MLREKGMAMLYCLTLIKTFYILKIFQELPKEKIALLLISFKRKESYVIADTLL